MESHLHSALPGPPKNALLSMLPQIVKRALLAGFWMGIDGRDFLAEIFCWIPSHLLRRLGLQSLGVKIGPNTSVHRGCRLYVPSRVQIGAHCVINRDVLLDGRMGLNIGSNTSISEGVGIFSLEHDPNSNDFRERGACVTIADHVFIGARAILLPGVTIGRGACVAAGAVVTRDVDPLTIVAGVPARVIGQRRNDLSYTLNYQKFLG